MQVGNIGNQSSWRGGGGVDHLERPGGMCLGEVSDPRSLPGTDIHDPSSPFFRQGDDMSN